MTHIGFWLAMAMWLVVGWQLGANFAFGGDFAVVASLRECQQPMNNRCRDVYRLRAGNGDEHVETLADFPQGAHVGRHVSKEKYAMSYRIDGRSMLVVPNGDQTLMSLVGLLFFGIAIHWAYVIHRH